MCFMGPFWVSVYNPFTIGLLFEKLTLVNI